MCHFPLSWTKAVTDRLLVYARVAHKETSHFEPLLADFPPELSERTNKWSRASVLRQSHQLQRACRAQAGCPVACPEN